MAKTKSLFTIYRIQSKCGKMRTTITPNTDTFYAVKLATHQILLHRGIDDIAIQDNKGIGFELKNCLRHFKTGSSEKYTHQR